jgi:Uma2 family endonuclease
MPSSTLVAMDVVARPLTLDEFFELPYYYAELVNGQPVVMNTPAGPHQMAATRLALMLVSTCPDGYDVLAAPLDWILRGDPRGTVRQPDVMVATVEQLRQVKLTAPPLLAVEIVSESSIERDLVTKRREYAQAGCAHYWLVVPSRPEIVRLRRDPATGEYVEIGRVCGDDGPVTIDEPYPMTLDARRLQI